MSIFNNAVTIIHFLVLIFIMVAGITRTDPNNLTPFAPYGTHGAIKAFAVLFFSYMGFDAVSTMAEETKNPARFYFTFFPAKTKVPARKCYNSFSALLSSLIKSEIWLTQSLSATRYLYGHACWICHSQGGCNGVGLLLMKGGGREALRGNWLVVLRKGRTQTTSTVAKSKAYALVGGYKCGCVQLAREAFDKIKTRDAATWSAMVLGLAVNLRNHEAIELFVEMEKVGLKGKIKKEDCRRKKEKGKERK
ncbi:hypothetical protein Fmac_011258 [Flemingia macrophylla]|uniref:Amino acid permease/ SLC12A domain-containing protein n=1 Tax=Flemingia macrophylla TaxID=520843 RepID=A0ABD1MMQ5_9FABA